MTDRAPEPTPEDARPERRLTEHAATWVALVVALFFLGMVPQARNVVFQVPGLGQGPLWIVAGFYLFLVGLVVLNIGLLVAVVPREGGERGRLARWLHAPFRVIDWGGRPVAFLLAVGGLLLALFREQLATTVLDAPALGAAGALVLVAGIGALLPRAVGPAPARELLARSWSALALTFVIGHAVWLAAPAFPGVLSARNYTIWALMQIAFGLVLVGRVLDAAHRLAPLNVRLWAVVALAVFAPFAEREDVGRATGAAPEHTWLEALEARLDALPPEGPAVILTASGGGARAALFASLVLEALAEAPVESFVEEGGASFADHLLLLSGVSGGSLACGWYATRYPQPPRDTLRSSFEGELAARVADFAREMAAAARDSGGQVDPTVFAQVIESCEALERAVVEGAALPDLPVEFLSAYADDMCADHMAPILRGILHPGLGRGEALARSWERSFDWAGIDNLSWSRADRPLLLLGATHAQRGRRLALGFPPLAGDWLADDLDTLAAHDPTYSVGLAQAVRLSAGFPWLMPVARLDVPTADLGGALDTDGLHLVDGGVVDNTGVDTVVAVVRRLDQLGRDGADGDPAADRARRIVGELRRRGVLLVEVDSGAKKRDLSAASRWLPGLEPVEALQIALDQNASRAARAGVAELRTVLRRRGRRLTDMTANSVTHVVLSADLFTDVMTAWALGPEDKAAVWGTFLFGFPSALEDLRLGYGFQSGAATGGQRINNVAARVITAEERAFVEEGVDVQALIDQRRDTRDAAMAVLAPKASPARATMQVTAELGARLARVGPRPRCVGATPDASARGADRVYLELDGAGSLDLTGWSIAVEGLAGAWELESLDGPLEPGARQIVMRRGREPRLPTEGGTLLLLDPGGREVDRWTYGPSRGVLLKRAPLVPVRRGG